MATPTADPNNNLILLNLALTSVAKPGDIYEVFWIDASKNWSNDYSDVKYKLLRVIDYNATSVTL
jgi:hypothetical protein